MKTKSIITASILSLVLVSQGTLAGDSVKHSGLASKHTVLAGSHATVSTAKVASGVVAVPLIIVGKTGEVVGKAGEKLMSTATTKQPLIISDVTITADVAPDKALQDKEKK